jgi:hypothetical protein
LTLVTSDEATIDVRGGGCVLTYRDLGVDAARAVFDPDDPDSAEMLRWLGIPERMQSAEIASTIAVASDQQPR